MGCHVLFPILRPGGVSIIVRFLYIQYSSKMPGPFFPLPILIRIVGRHRRSVMRQLQAQRSMDLLLLLTPPPSESEGGTSELRTSATWRRARPENQELLDGSRVSKT